jgi:hypothetical protein
MLLDLVRRSTGVSESQKKAVFDSFRFPGHSFERGSQRYPEPMADRAPDGRLEDWADLDDIGWESLLVGNGMSIDVSSYFAYDSLYEGRDGSPRA